MKRLFTGFVLLALTACQRQEDPEPEVEVKVRCVTPTRQAIEETVQLRGHIEPPAGGDLPLASTVAGRIVAVLVHEGQALQTGQIVAEVDDVATREAVRQSEAALAQTVATQANSNATLERTQALVGRGIAARQELDDASAKSENDKQAVAAARATLDLARRTLGRVQVRIAFSGVVTKVWRGAGAIVDGSAATPIAQVAASSNAEFVADATERDLLKLEQGLPASISLAPASPALEGTIRTISSALDPATGLGTVRIALTHAPPVLIMGAHGRVSIATRRRESVLTVPAAALRGAVSDGSELVLCEGKVARLHNVQVGYRDEQRVEVTAGLAETDHVAIDHVLGLDEGTALVVVP